MLIYNEHKNSRVNFAAFIRGFLLVLFYWTYRLVYCCQQAGETYKTSKIILHLPRLLPSFYFDHFTKGAFLCGCFSCFTLCYVFSLNFNLTLYLLSTLTFLSLSSRSADRIPCPRRSQPKKRLCISQRRFFF